MNSNKLVRTVVPPTHVTVHAGNALMPFLVLMLTAGSRLTETNTHSSIDKIFILISSFSTPLLIRSQIAGSLFRISVPVESRSILVMTELIFYFDHK